MAGAMLGSAIRFLLAMTIGACFVFGMIGAGLRPFMLSIGAAVLPLIAAVASIGSDEPLIREMAPYAAVGVTIALIVGGAIRSRIER